MSVTESARTLARGLLELLLPSVCLACGRQGDGGLGLCRRCRGRLERLRPPLCRLCGRPLEAAAAPPGFRCGRCRRRPSALDRLVPVWSYQPPLDSVIHALKYQRLEYLGRQIALAIHDLAPGIPGAEMVVPVPLHWRRHLARGYNQAEAIARPLAALLGLPLVAALRRVRATPPQARLGLDRRQRAENLRGAFRPRRRHPVRGRRVLLVDDVATTGATLEAAATALKSAGAARIAALTAARTPEGLG